MLDGRQSATSSTLGAACSARRISLAGPGHEDACASRVAPRAVCSRRRPQKAKACPTIACSSPSGSRPSIVPRSARGSRHSLPRVGASSRPRYSTCSVSPTPDECSGSQRCRPHRPSCRPRPRTILGLTARKAAPDCQSDQARSGRRSAGRSRSGRWSAGRSASRGLEAGARVGRCSSSKRTGALHPDLHKGIATRGVARVRARCMK
jgi:hypothetical protein